ncbi:type IV secretory system conjugative DNA transfer family protein [Bosea sp. (in: a-proteobacteria)]|uniref:type IV secretory system conjugative DNA transfer family protein n=1 Tax=Bosea sp. (in: a-proteobacteria) TaxID=1871050 RepID=UPI004034B089
MTAIPATGDDARRRIRARVPRAPVNRLMLMATSFGVLAAATWPGLNGDGMMMGISGMTTVMALAASARAWKNLRRDYQLRYGVAVSEQATADHGSARQSTPQERAARGMDSQEHGGLFGLDDDGNPVWRPKNGFLCLTEMPPGVGKTSNLVAGSIFHYAMLGHSVWVPDPKDELGVQLAPMLRKLGFEVFCLNAAGEHQAIIGDTEVSLYAPFLEALYGNRKQRRKAIKLAADYAALHHPMTGDEKQPYFGHGSRRAILFAICAIGIIDPANCTPTRVYELLTDPAQFLKLCRRMQKYQTMTKDDRVLDVVRREARNLMYRADKNEENFASFLEGASQKLISFNGSGMFGDYGAGAIHALSDIRDRQIIVFVITPLAEMREAADFISLANHNLVAAVKAKPDGHPVHIVGEEALNYRFSDLTSNLETLRQLRVTIDLYIQSFNGLALHYGKEAAAAIEAYADIRVYAGLTYGRAKHVSEMLSDRTISRQDVSYDATVRELGIASREMARPLMKANEVAGMPKNQAWMFVNGLHPVRLTMLSYAQVSPWRDWVDPSPITGTRLHAETVLTITYGSKGSPDAH